MPYKFSTAEYADMVYVYGLCNGSTLHAVAEYERRFPNRKTATFNSPERPARFTPERNSALKQEEVPFKRAKTSTPTSRILGALIIELCGIGYDAKFGKAAKEKVEYMNDKHRKLPSIGSYWVEGKPWKNPKPGNLARPGFEPGPPGFAARRADRYSTGVDSMIVPLPERNEILHRFSKEMRTAGKKWYYAFKRRHPQLNLRQPESTSFARAKGFDKENEHLKCGYGTCELSDRIRNEALLDRVGEERMMLNLIRKRKRNWLGHWLRRNCLLKDALEEIGEW
ncbi:hypothetical protein ANN_17810 [Periplaneta americana]|uniref:DUF4817 domain-containing protein n=1 Tax=Periplaneta americana TaxID=6978 RepID=A0ABQ8SU00_PERAM|nr:hypothetical protein ANN_17810 [Periplaneta americana]